MIGFTSLRFSARYAFIAFACVLVVSAARAGGPPQQAMAVEAPRRCEFSLTLDTGWREDDLEWTIAGDSHGHHPNILSDLEWKDVEIVPVALMAEVKLRDGWRVEIGGEYGWMTDGRNRDSDYDSSDRRDEFSRSYADTRGHTIDAEFALGHDLRPVARVITFTPWLGLDYHQQHLNDRNGLQVIDKEFGDLGPFQGLDSVYQAEWFGVMAGLDASVRLSDSTRLKLAARYEHFTYEAEADWNLRSDLSGFSHRANGDGWRLCAGLEWDIAPRWTLELRGEWSLFQTHAGVDHTDFSDGTTDETRLNEVEWGSVAVRAGVTYRL